MMKVTLSKSALAFFLLAAVPSDAVVSGQQTQLDSRGQLQQYVTQLQANPSDDVLRTKIIQLALTLNPKPAVPEDASVDAAKGKAIFADATLPDDMKAAAAAFAQASQLAPWVPDYYYNEGLALEKAKQYDDAIHALNFYLLAAPNAPDAADVRGKVEAIKYEKDSAARQEEQQEQARAAANAQRQEADLRAALSGVWYVDVNGQHSAWKARFHLSGDNLTIVYGMGPNDTVTDLESSGNGTLTGRSFEGRFTEHRGDERGECLMGQFRGTISEDNMHVYLSVSDYVNPELTAADRAIFIHANGLNCPGEDNFTLSKGANQ